MLKVELIGKRNFSINISEILKWTKNENLLKMEDKTTLSYDLEELASKNTLKGIFVKNMLKKIKEEPEKEETILKAIEITLQTF